MTQPKGSESSPKPAGDDYRSVMASVDRDGKRRRLLVRIMGGSWRRRRQIAAVFLVVIYLGAPFVTIGGAPLIQFDIPERRFWLFGQVFWPQDFYYFLLFILIFIVGTIAAVATLGRVFCGWLCPHNLFMELLFRPLENFILGPAEKRTRLERERSGNQNLLRTAVKWLVFIAVSGALANAGTALFVGTDGFIQLFGWPLIVDPLAHPAAAVFFVGFMLACLLDFGVLREQVCTVVCPYGRLQAAMLDRESLQVLYHEQRGEPRGKPGKVVGDCVDCGLCVQVCPTGIDIRNGSQLECINCTACIDACNSVMVKLKREPDLIRFSSEAADQDGHRHRLLRPRSAIYAVALGALVTLTVVMLILRQPVRVEKLRASTAEVAIDGTGTALIDQPVGFAILNQSATPVAMTFTLPPDVPGSVLPSRVWQVPADSRVHDELRVIVPRDALNSISLATEVIATWEDADGEAKQQTIPVTLRRPLTSSTTEEP